MNRLRSVLKRSRSRRIQGNQTEESVVERSESPTTLNPFGTQDRLPSHPQVPEQHSYDEPPPYQAATATTDAAPATPLFRIAAESVPPKSRVGGADPSPKEPDLQATTSSGTAVGPHSIWQSELVIQAAPHLELDEESMFPYEDANPCSMCRSLTLENMLVRKQGHSREVPAGGCKHHDSWSALDESANSGCRICTILRDALLTATGGNDKYLRRTGPKYAIHIRSEATKRSVMVGPFEVDISSTFDNNVLNRTVASSDIGLCTDIGDPAADFVRARRLSKTVDLGRILYEIERWMECRKAFLDPYTELPKRVIDVSSSPDPLVVNLKEFGDLPSSVGVGRYVCLSHRWGQQTQPLTTTTATLSQRLQGIPLKDLTRTFRNAIAITRRLGVQYIWIDSLCILQDSREDWEEESSKMGKYYKSSWLTFGAGMPGDGLFTERLPPSKPYCRLIIPSGEAGTRNSTVYFSQEPHTMAIRSIDGPKQSPLYTRGWTLQEEILSPRFISFEPTQVYFRCPNYLDYECGYRELVSRWKCLSEQHLNDKNLWVRLVEDFSNRNLTVISDKLPALSGLAQVYEGKWQDTYLAGLWKNEIWKHLLWYAKKPQRPAEYLGPSWSWVSVSSPVIFAGNRFASSCMKLIDASTNAVGKNPFGRVDRGSLVLYAPVTQLQVRHPSAEDVQEGQTVTLHFDDGQVCKFEADEILTAEINLVTLVYISDAIGIVVVPATETSADFRRIGLGFASTTLQTATKATIRIV